MKWGRWVALAAVGLGAGAFATLNAGERTALNLGVVMLYRVSTVRLALGAFLLGMVAMYLVGLRQDLRVKRLLERHGLLDSRGMAREPHRAEPERPRWEAPVSEPLPPRFD